MSAQACYWELVMLLLAIAFNWAPSFMYCKNINGSQRERHFNICTHLDKKTNVHQEMLHVHVHTCIVCFAQLVYFDCGTQLSFDHTLNMLNTMSSSWVNIVCTLTVITHART